MADVLPGNIVYIVNVIGVFLRVFAREMDGVYYMSCRRPDSDSDEICSTRGSGLKSNCERTLLVIRAQIRCVRASKGAIFWVKKYPFFGQNFLLSSRRDMFAMGF